MNWLSLFSGSIDKIVDSVGEAIDKNFTNDEEKLVLKNELAKIAAQAKLETENSALKHEKEITERWVSDNKNGSFLAKNVRPLSLVYLLFIISVLAFADGNIGEFVINPAYVVLFQTLAVTAFSAYFIARSVDKFGVNKKPQN